VTGSHPVHRTESWARYRVPEVPSGSLARPRVAEAIGHAVRRHRVTVMAAPSGYGKTTAVAAWAAHQHRPVAWLSLGPADGDPSILASGVVHALRTVVDSAAAPPSPLLEVDPGVDTLTMYHQICQAVHALDTELLVVVDDAHRAGARWDAGLLGMLVDGAPDQLRMLLVGTTALEALLAKRIITEQDAYLSAADLAFTVEETRGILDRSGTPLDAREVLDYTAGWPIAVRMASLGGGWPAAQASDPEILLRDYVHDHVLAALPEKLATFVLTATVCSELTADLATALSGRADAADLLEDLADQGIFLNRYAGRNEAVVYRWHPVFARQCTRILARQDSAALGTIHRRAGEYLLPVDPLAALRHFVAARDDARVLAGLLASWVDLIVGEHAHAVATFCAGLPERLCRRPAVQLIQACAEDLMGERIVARSRFAAACGRLPAAGDDEDLATVLPLARLLLADDRRETGQASRDVQAFLASTGGIGARQRAAVLFLLGWAEFRLRLHPDLAPELLSAAARHWAALGDTALERRALSLLALVDAWAGRHGAARRVLATLVVPGDSPGAPWAYYGGGPGAIGAGIVAFWSADYETACREFVHALDAEASRFSFGGAARMLLAFSAAGTQDTAWCRRAAAELQAIPRADPHGGHGPLFRDAARAVLEEAAGHRARALALVERHAAIEHLPLVGAVLAGILRRAGDPTAALHLLSRHQEYLGISYLAVSAKATAAVVHKRRGEPDLAHELCEQALEIAAREDIRQPFCDGDLGMRLLLSEHLTRKTAFESFITECLTAEHAGGVLSTLSAREVDVFRLLQTSKTIREIAGDLAVSVNTVKTHQRSIYRKLGVQSRREAQRVAP
jgi:LuxR family transcriptional regulator, maltose regulon positive regulatory protein